MGEEAKDAATCANSYLVFGVALGWLFPLIFHYLGVSGSKKLEKRRERKRLK